MHSINICTLSIIAKFACCTVYSVSSALNAILEPIALLGEVAFEFQIQFIKEVQSQVYAYPCLLVRELDALF